MRHSLLGACCALLLASAALAAPDANQLTMQAAKAYEAKQFAEAAALYMAAGQAGANKIDSPYNAACSYALAGKADEAFAQLFLAMEAGLRQDPAMDPDFKSLQGDPRWKQVQERFSDAHPEAKFVPMLTDKSKSSAERYFIGRAAVAGGVPVFDTNSMFNQMYGNAAQNVGEYDEATRIYGVSQSMDDPIGEGFNHAVDAVPVVLARAKGRQAVFLNESHGLTQTRAANYALLAGLRAEGFDTLGIETLAANVVARDSAHCSDATLLDEGLQARGYALLDSGYYTTDPVFAEIIREALRLGFRLVPYDPYHAEHNQAQREQTQADNLACVFKADPKARLLVIGGFAHIDEGESNWVKEGGMMARRFRVATGIDPLTVDTAKHTHLDPKALGLDTSTRLAPSYVLQNDKGETFGGEQVDIALFVPAPAHRNDGLPSWLELGGARKRVAVARAECKDKDPCLAEARRVGEDAKAVPSDRCVLGGADNGCTLFLPPGQYEIATYDSAGAELGRRGARVHGE
jgi:tetratricopeptide (TPR) repeat protein